MPWYRWNVPLDTLVDGEFLFGPGSALECAENCRVTLTNHAKFNISSDDITCFRRPWAGFKGLRLHWPEGKKFWRSFDIS